METASKQMFESLFAAYQNATTTYKQAKIAACQKAGVDPEQIRQRTETRLDERLQAASATVKAAVKAEFELWYEAFARAANFVRDKMTDEEQDEPAERLMTEPDGTEKKQSTSDDEDGQQEDTWLDDDWNEMTEQWGIRNVIIGKA